MSAAGACAQVLQGVCGAICCFLTLGLIPRRAHACQLTRQWLDIRPCQ
jgi:hypothetical protein